MWQRRKRRDQGQAEELHSIVASEEPDRRCDNEFDAYLAGAYAEWALQNHQSIPAWAWVNRVAHASLTDLHTMVSQSHISASSPDLVAWEHLVSFLAKEVLATVGGDDTWLQDLQQQVLVPVELCLAEEWWRAVAPSDLATLVTVALQNASRHR